MKLMIASDIHGSAQYAGQMVDAFRREGADRLLLLGDLLYHGARNALPAGYDTMRTFALLNEIKDNVIAVRGNCDSEVDQMVLEFPMMADYAMLQIDDQTVYATHGHLATPDAPPPMVEGTLFVSGHTHIPGCETRNGCWFANPGSVSIPKEGTERGYLLLECGLLSHRNLDGCELASWHLPSAQSA